MTDALILGIHRILNDIRHIIIQERMMGKTNRNCLCYGKKNTARFRFYPRIKEEELEILT